MKILIIFLIPLLVCGCAWGKNSDDWQTVRFDSRKFNNSKWPKERNPQFDEFMNKNYGEHWICSPQDEKGFTQCDFHRDKK